MSSALPGNPFDSEYAEQTDAILALAYEQRTANLIAFLNNVEAHNIRNGLAPTDAARKVGAQILKRLGLNESNAKMGAM